MKYFTMCFSHKPLSVVRLDQGKMSADERVIKKITATNFWFF